MSSRVRDLIDYLQGTCHSLEEGLEQMGLDALTTDEHSVLDGEIFLCSACGWWCEQSEANANPDNSGEDICDDCKGEKDDEEN